MRRAIRFSTQSGGAPTVDEWVGRVQRLEELGYSAVLMPDHMLGTQLWSVFPALAAAAMAAPTIRLGTLVLANDFRNPLLLAREVATLDVVSKGRVELGLGAGWSLRDYESLGIPYERGRVRVARLGEAVTVLKRLFTEDEVTFEGHHYRLRKAQLGPKPTQQPHPPIHIAGGGREILRLAGREADIVGIVSMATSTGGVPNDREVTYEAAAEKVGWVREAAGEQFGSIELSMFLDVTLTDDPERTVRELAERLERPPERITRSVYRVVGTIDDVRARILKMRDELGITYFCMRGAHVEELGALVRELNGR